MSEYRYNEETKKGLFNKPFKTNLLLVILSILIALGLAAYRIKDYDEMIFTVGLTTIIMGISIFIGIKLGLKILKNNQRNIIFKIEDGVFKVIKKGKDDIIVDRDKINKIEQYDNESIIIFSKDKNNILLNSNIENYEELIKELNDICEIKHVGNQKNNIIILISVIVMASLILIFYKSTDKIVVLSTGAIISGLILYSYIKILLNKYIDKKFKVCMLFMFIVIFRVIQKILYLYGIK
jgi:sulfur relay (sulfurtransferase) DsrF/TusC family protein